MPQQMTRWFACSLLLALSACGFHLQGREKLPASLAAVRIEAIDPQSDFHIGLRNALRGSGATLVEGGGNPAVIRILADGTSEKVLTVSSLNIPTAYQLDYTIRISVSVGGQELMAPESHTLSREYSFDEKKLLAKERERELLSAGLSDDLVTLVMRRLANLPPP